MGLLWASFLIILLSIAPAISGTIGVLPGCPERCGDIPVPYPFGIAPNCYRPGFGLTCNSSSSPPKLFIPVGDLQVSSISDSFLLAKVPISSDCHNPTGNGPATAVANFDVSGTPFAISSRRNKLTGIGCDTVALCYQGIDIDAQARGCLAICNDPSAIANGTCEGVGCCQTSIPRGLRQMTTTVGALNNHSDTYEFSPCSFAFIADQDSYAFQLKDFQSLRERSSVLAAFNWAIGSQPCAAAEGSPSFACGANSVCVNATESPGYVCQCVDGYKGNPYLENGCQDIDECADSASNPCSGICTNLPGSFACSCPKGRTGDGRKAGQGCVDSRRFPLLQIILGIGLGSAFLVGIASWVYWAMKKRRMILLREEWFKRNGGMMLRQRMSSSGGGGGGGARIFTAKELHAATKGYSEGRVLGKGGHGTVYRGTLPEGVEIAVKRSRVVDKSEVEQFIKEVVILSQIDHPNVVKILGCCLETEVPLLVYEYVANGSLSRHLHDPSFSSSLSWDARLRIAAETAAALAYLHGAAGQPIVHRDVKAGNILLDDDLTAKVSDFGASRLIPLGKGQVMTLVQGTMGYLDPEYFQTGLLMESSDVYSFGVVMAELLTGQKPLSEGRPPGEHNLAIFFLRALRSGRITDVLEPRVRNEGRWEQVVGAANVAGRCLSLKGEDRPTMKEVAADLASLVKGLNASRLGGVEEGRMHREDSRPLIDGDSFLSNSLYMSITSR